VLHIPEIMQSYLYFPTLGDANLKFVTAIGWRFKDLDDDPWSQRFLSLKEAKGEIARNAGQALAAIFGPHLKKRRWMIIPGMSSQAEQADPTSAIAIAAEALSAGEHDYEPEILLHTPHNRLTLTGSSSDRHATVSGTYFTSDEREDELAGRHIVLIDDLVTNGHTLQDAARALNSVPNKPARVIGIAFGKNEGWKFASERGHEFSNEHIEEQYARIWDSRPVKP
jgi:hypothetical protein